MAQQARAVKTRRTILEAAAAVFDEYGYEGASTTEILARSGLTRGALYFHFPSKEAIADAVVDAQSEALVPPENKVKLQATIDLAMAFAHRLRTDVVLRAGVRLSVEQASYKNPNVAPYQGAADVILNLLKQAQEGGELLASVDPEEVAQLIIGAFTGIQLLSQVYDKRRDLPLRVAALWKYLLPALAIPGLLPHLIVDPQRVVAAEPVAEETIAEPDDPSAEEADPAESAHLMEAAADTAVENGASGSLPGRTSGSRPVGSDPEISLTEAMPQV